MIVCPKHLLECIITFWDRLGRQTQSIHSFWSGEYLIIAILLLPTGAKAPTKEAWIRWVKYFKFSTTMLISNDLHSVVNTCKHMVYYNEMEIRYDLCNNQGPSFHWQIWEHFIIL